MSPRWETPHFNLLQAGVRRFLGGPSGAIKHATVLTDTRRPTVGWRGITDDEVRALTGGGYATVGEPDVQGRQVVTLTAKGLKVRDELARVPSSPQLPMSRVEASSGQSPRIPPIPPPGEVRRVRPELASAQDNRRASGR